MNDMNTQLAQGGDPERISLPDYDLCVIGGGINGAGIARDAAGRGMRVVLLEKGDLAQATSSASTKLVHGGLRYLEFYEFSLVRKSLQERERLLHIAPHIIWPMDFVLPHHAAVRPLWMIRAGLFLYDILGGQKTLRSSRLLNLSTHNYGTPLKAAFRKGFSYADCAVRDARLVVLNAMDARERGANIITRARCTNLKCADSGFWRVEFEDVDTQRGGVLSAAMVVNAAGPWVEELLRDSGFYTQNSAIPHIKLVKGSHIIVPRQYDGDQCYMLQQDDGRIVFSIPYEDQFTLIGTTDTPYEGDALAAEIDPQEVAYLCAAYNTFFQKQITPGDIVWSYSGVRALFDDGKDDARKVTRDYRLFHHDNYAAPMISIFGGKITTYRQLSEKAVDMLCGLFPDGGQRWGRAWTQKSVLPGGDIPAKDMSAFIEAMRAQYPWMEERILYHYCHHYGTAISALVSDAGCMQDLGNHYGGGLYQAEITYLMTYEFAKDPDDILWRRTKWGLHIDAASRDEIAAFMAAKNLSKP